MTESIKDSGRNQRKNPSTTIGHKQWKLEEHPAEEPRQEEDKLNIERKENETSRRVEAFMVEKDEKQEKHPDPKEPKAQTYQDLIDMEKRRRMLIKEESKNELRKEGEKLTIILTEQK